MSTYINKNMRNHEVLVKKADHSFVPMIPTILIALLCLIVGVVMMGNIPEVGAVLIFYAILAVIVKAILLSSIELGVTNKKIIGKTGVFLARSIDAYLEKIDNFSISETLGGKIFGYATIEICTSSMHIRFQYIHNAIEFKNIVMDAIDAKEEEKLKKQAYYIESAKTDSKVLVAPTGGSSKVCRCGNTVPANAAFCTKCGTRF